MLMAVISPTVAWQDSSTFTACAPVQKLNLTQARAEQSVVDEPALEARVRKSHSLP
jgi:hypothetical protein